MSGEVNQLRQQLAYQTGLNDGIRQGGGMPGGNFFTRGMPFASGCCNSFMGFCANMNRFGGGFGGGFSFGGGFGGFGMNFGFGPRVW